MLINIIVYPFRALFRPRTFFAELSGKCSLTSAIAFYITLFVIVPCATLFIVAAVVVLGYLPITIPLSAAALIPLTIALFAYGIISIIVMMVTSLFMHLFVMLFSGKGGFGGTFSVLVYSNAATVLYQILIAVTLTSMVIFKITGFFMLVMAIALLGMIWLLTIPVIGYRAIHKMGTLRAAAAVYIPALIVFGIAFAGQTYIGRLQSKLPDLENLKSIVASFSAQKSAQIPKSVSAVSIMQAATAKYKLTAIGLSAGKPNAVINDVIVKVGDSVGDATVVDIKKDRVVISLNGKEIVLEM